MNLIYQYFEKSIGKDIVGVGNDYHLMSVSSISKYASRIATHYKFFQRGALFTPFYGIFLPFLNGLCDDYNNICFVDCDILATTKCEDVFAHSSREVISYNLMNDGYLTVKPLEKTEIWGEHGHGNSGVVIFPRSQYNNIKMFIGDLREHWKNRKDVYGNYDQLIINQFAQKHGFHRLDQSFNYHLGRYDFDRRMDMNLIHYHRKHKGLMKSDFEKDIILK
jgi:hypothetical protein